MMMPTIMSDAMSDEPPADTNGRGLPVVGTRPMTQPMFRNAWNTSMMVTLPATMRSLGVAAALAMRMPANRMQQNSAMTTNAPSMPNSSPMMENTKSVSASGR